MQLNKTTCRFVTS